jgi:uncharacterized cupin superfamily protein
MSVDLFRRANTIDRCSNVDGQAGRTSVVSFRWAEVIDRGSAAGAPRPEHPAASALAPGRRGSIGGVITHTSAAAVDVPTEPLAADCVVAGAPASGVVDLPSPPGLEVGIWEHTVGTSTDVEADEVFVVLSGRATIACDQGPTIDIGPGDVVTLTEGIATTWTIHETLRKVYVTLG